MIVEIATAGRHIHGADGFLIVGETRLPMEDIDALVLSTPAVSITGEVLTRLASQGSTVVICDRSFRVTAVLIPVAQHSRAPQRVTQQAELADATRRELWRQIVTRKISLQAEALAMAGMGGRANRLRGLANRVEAGDPSNIEARAARWYWPRLFGESFRRRPDGPAPNPALNYGYSVIRAALARAIVTGGLHPSIGLHHRSESNPWNLADDLIEPFRPLADLLVFSSPRLRNGDLDPAGKQEIAALLDWEVVIDGLRFSLKAAFASVVRSLTSAVAGKGRRLVLPESLHPRPGLQPVEPDAQSVPPHVDVRAL